MSILNGREYESAYSVICAHLASNTFKRFNFPAILRSCDCGTIDGGGGRVSVLTTARSYVHLILKGNGASLYEDADIHVSDTIGRFSLSVKNWDQLTRHILYITTTVR